MRDQNVRTFDGRLQARKTFLEQNLDTLILQRLHQRQVRQCPRESNGLARNLGADCGKMVGLVEYLLRVPGTTQTVLIQETRILLNHVTCERAGQKLIPA
jgi:hypothetical protein